MMILLICIIILLLLFFFQYIQGVYRCKHPQCIVRSYAVFRITFWCN